MAWRTARPSAPFQPDKEDDMSRLGTLEELPLRYREELLQENLAPLWPSMRTVLPHNHPARKTRPTFWSYKAIRPLLLEAGRLTPIEKAERRVLVLANPGLGSGGHVDRLVLGGAARCDVELRHLGRGDGLAESRQEAGHQALGDHRPLLGDQTAAHADLAVLADRVALQFRFDHPAILAHAGKRLGA